MSRVAIVGSCITRDLWPIVGVEPADLLYISRTSLPSLFAQPLAGVEIAEDPPEPLNAFPHRAMVADLKKQALHALAAHEPTHIIFDFIDERLDLLAVGGAIVTHSWELEVSGYLSQPVFAAARTIAKTSPNSDLLWRQAAREMAAFIASTPLCNARLILHGSRWARDYLDHDGTRREFDEEVEIFEGKPARITAHNALLARYETLFRAAAPGLAEVSAPAELRLGDARHRWGLSPFHYVEDYYREVWRQLQALGV